VDAALRAVTGAPLPPAFAALSVRDIVLGRAALSEAGAPVYRYVHFWHTPSRNP
jgi:hypothetical protein